MAEPLDSVSKQFVEAVEALNKQAAEAIDPSNPHDRKNFAKALQIAESGPSIAEPKIKLNPSSDVSAASVKLESGLINRFQRANMVSKALVVTGTIQAMAGLKTVATAHHDSKDRTTGKVDTHLRWEKIKMGAVNIFMGSLIAGGSLAGLGDLVSGHENKENPQHRQ